MEPISPGYCDCHQPIIAGSKGSSHIPPSLYRIHSIGLNSVSFHKNIDANSPINPYLKIEKSYFHILDALILKSKSSNVTTHQSIYGLDPIPFGSKSEDGFKKGFFPWYKFLLSETLDKLKLKTQNGKNSAEHGEYVRSADVAVLVLNPYTEKLLMSPTPEEIEPNPVGKIEFFDLFNARLSQGFHQRCKEKPSQTYVINIMENPKPELVLGWPGVNHDHITDLKSLYKAHLKLAAGILSCPPEALEWALNEFETEWKNIFL